MQTVTIGRKRWRLAFGPVVRGIDGHCDAPETTGKKITIRRSLLKRPRRLMEVLIHEGLHASDWSKDEAWIEATAEDLARLLWGMGFRLQSGEKQ